MKISFFVTQIYVLIFSKGFKIVFFYIEINVNRFEMNILYFTGQFKKCTRIFAPLLTFQCAQVIIKRAFHYKYF